MFARLWERSLFGNLRASERLALSSLGGTCINVYLFLQRRKGDLVAAGCQDASPHNVLSVLTEVGWATGCTLRVRESRTSQPRICRNDLFVPVELVSCRWQQSQGGYKRSWRRFGSHETRTPTLNGLQCPNIKQATTKAEQCKKISHRGRWYEPRHAWTSSAVTILVPPPLMKSCAS